MWLVEPQEDDCHDEHGDVNNVEELVKSFAEELQRGNVNYFEGTDSNPAVNLLNFSKLSRLLLNS